MGIPCFNPLWGWESRFWEDHRVARAALPLWRALSNIGNLEGAINLGVLCIRAGQTAEARNAFARAVEIDPTHDVAQEQLARLDQALADQAKGVGTCIAPWRTRPRGRRYLDVKWFPSAA